MVKNNLEPTKRRFPKILVGAPVYSGKYYITPAWVESVKNLSYSNYDVVVVDNGKYNKKFLEIFSKNKIKVIRSKNFENPIKTVTMARQKIYDCAINGGYDYLLSIEQDILAPKSIIKDLLFHKKLIVGAPYPVSAYTNWQRRRIDYIISASKLKKVIGKIDGVDINEWYISKEIENKGLLKVKSCSLGCTLISTEVLRKIKARCNPKINRADDSYFFQECYNKHVEVYLDTSLLWKISHISSLIKELNVGGQVHYDKYR